MRNWLIHILGGFATTQEAVDFIKKVDNVPQKNELLSEAVIHLFNTISSDDILRVNERGEWIFQGKPLLTAQMEVIKGEKKFFQSSILWKILQNDIKFQLNRKMYLESNITYDVMWGKLCLYLSDIIQTRINKI